MKSIRLAQIKADFRADLRANRLPNTTELDAWRSAVTSRSPNPPLDRTDSTSAHSGSVVPNDARLGGVGPRATVSGHDGACAPASPTSGGAGTAPPAGFFGSKEA